MPKAKIAHTMSATHEVLQLLQEECAEVIQAASKCIRFGESENQYNLEKEIGDLFCILDIMHQYDMFSLTKAESYYEEKYEKLKKYTNLDL
jgi:NTP pyrophosphatase (non-canonical NTP hydrolase)